jgi:hypothetical protein
MVRKEQIKLSVDALYLENIKKDKSFLWNKTKLIMRNPFNEETV